MTLHFRCKLSFAPALSTNPKIIEGWCRDPQQLLEGEAALGFIVRLLLPGFSNPFSVAGFVSHPCSGNRGKKAEFDHIHENVKHLDFIGLEAY